MAKGNLTYKLSLLLESAGFKKGAKSVQSSLNGLKKTILQFSSAIGVGLGLGTLIREMTQTAQKLSVANATLKNVSKTSAAFADNQKFLNELASKYKQDIISLIQGFAQFSAAADTCNVSLEDQRKIYESLTRAAAFYHMSADQTNNMMIAVTQMMSKGKVASEELRRQLGNSLPGAFGIMAKAIGVSNSELESMMKKGQVLSGEVLPKFANELNKITDNIDLNSLQSAINDMGNQWTKFVTKLNVEGKLKSLYTAVTKILVFISNNLEEIKDIIIIGLFAKLNSFLVGNYRQIASLFQFLKIIFKYGENGINRVIKLTNGGLSQLGKKLLSLKSAFVNFLPIAAITTAVYLLGKEVARYKEINKLAKEQSDKIKDAVKQENYEQKELNKLIELGSTLNEKSELRTKWINDCNEALGLEASNAYNVADANDAIITKLRARYKMLQDIAEIEAINAEIANNSEWLNDPKNRKRYEKAKSFIREDERGSGFRKFFSFPTRRIAYDEMKVRNESNADYKSRIEEIVNGWADEIHKGNQKVSKAYDDAVAELKKRLVSTDGELSKEEFDKIFKDLTSQYYGYSLQGALPKVNGNTNTNNSKGKETLTDLEKVIDKGIQSEISLNSQLSAGAITADEYSKAMIDLREDTFKAISAIDGFREQLLGLDEARQNFAAGIESGFRNDVQNSQIESIKSGINEVMPEIQNLLAEALNVKPENRDTFFDYRKDDNEILQEQVDILDDYVDRLGNIKSKVEELKEQFPEFSSFIDMIFANFNKQSELAINSANDLQQALDYSEKVKDIKSLYQEMSDSIGSSLKSTATAMDRLVEGYKSIRDVLEDDDASYWEKMITIINEVIQSFEILNSVIEAYKALDTIIVALEKAKNAEKKKEIATTLILGEAEKKKASWEVLSAAATAGSSAGKVPIIGAVLALGAIAAIVAALATVSGKFADGGIIGGTSTTGDKQLARVNSGEMILNKGQQATLFNAISSGNLGGGKVDFVIRGDRLEGVLQNYNMKKRS